MNKSDFKNFIKTGRSNHVKKPLESGPSLVDPTFARTGRQMIFNPLPIEYKMKYPDGAPLNKEDPFKFNEFDKLYPDTFKAMREANSCVADTKNKLTKLQQQTKSQNNESEKN